MSSSDSNLFYLVLQKLERAKPEQLSPSTRLGAKATSYDLKTDSFIIRIGRGLLMQGLPIGIIIFEQDGRYLPDRTGRVVASFSTGFEKKIDLVYQRIESKRDQWEREATKRLEQELAD